MRSPQFLETFFKLLLFLGFAGALIYLDPTKSFLSGETPTMVLWWKRAILLLLLLFIVSYLRTSPGGGFPSWVHLLSFSLTAFLVIFLETFLWEEGFLSPYLTLLPFLALFLRVTLGLEGALFLTILFTAIVGLYEGPQFFPFLYRLLLGWVAIFAARAASHRSEILKVLFFLSVTALFLAQGFTFLERGTFGNAEAFWGPVLTGLLPGLLLFSILPLFERIFHISTDFLLLELSDLSHPVLRELSEKAPGTFTHSLLIGNLCEAAARNVRGNPLLARVAAYYHDLGKMETPQYYIENQGERGNPHDDLSPERSSEVLIFHVQAGADLAKRAGLPQEILRIIKTHHGTALIRPFYAKALEGGGNVSERDFRYPGPKPKTKEEVICMLADGVEAAARSLTDPTPEALRQVVQRIIEEKFQDGQLVEAKLTRRDLQRIGEAFLPVLSGVFHLRVPYPKEIAQGHGLEHST